MSAETQLSTYRLWQRILAVFYGLLCHALYAASVGSMIYSLYFGMARGFGTLSGGWAWLADGVLVLQFPLLHSLLLARPGKPVLRRLAPASLARDLETTTYASVASAQLLLTFLAWSPIGPVLWQPQGALLHVFQVVYAASWLFLGKTMSDAGLGVQIGLLGWSSVARNRAPSFAPFHPRGTFRFARHPIYWAFALGLWTAPIWTPDRVLIATTWTAYCAFGPLLKDRRYLRIHGDAYARYASLTSYWLPTLTKIEVEPIGPIEHGR